MCVGGEHGCVTKSRGMIEFWRVSIDPELSIFSITLQGEHSKRGVNKEGSKGRIIKQKGTMAHDIIGCLVFPEHEGPCQQMWQRPKNQKTFTLNLVACMRP